ncbi:hypothetical protein XPA_009726 [Xanthoria parietina]
MFLPYTLVTIILLPNLVLTAPPPLAPGVQVRQPFIYTHAPYTINYTSTTPPHQPGTTTTTHNFLTALEQALTHLESLRAQAHALPSDPIPGNSFHLRGSSSTGKPRSTGAIRAPSGSRCKGVLR